MEHHTPDAGRQRVTVGGAMTQTANGMATSPDCSGMPKTGLDPCDVAALW